jgi:hypothetical protein
VLSFRAVKDKPAYMTEPASAIRAAGCIIPEPGRKTTKTPQNPTITAVQRQTPTVSPSNGRDKEVTIIGAAKAMMTISARGMNRSA